MMNRRKFLKRIAGVAAISAVAPAELLRPNWADHTPDMVASDISGMLKLSDIVVVDVDVTAAPFVQDHTFDSLVYLYGICRKPGESDNELRQRHKVFTTSKEVEQEFGI